MSQDNVDKAREFIDAYNRRDFDVAVESFDPEIDEAMYHQVATFRAGKIVRMEYFGEWSEALAAAGLEG